MSSQFFSTRELSELCAVGETTVKRWANMGLIKYHKTIGGHRKFKLDDVLDFINKNHIRVAPELLERLQAQKRAAEALDLNTEILLVRGDVEALSEKLAEYLLGFKKSEAEALLSKAIERIPSFAVIFDQMIAPAMHRVGHLWCEKKLSITDEHIITNMVVEAILRAKIRYETSHQEARAQGVSALTMLYGNLDGAAPKGERKNPSAIVCTCPESELHEVALLGVSLVCESLGFQVRYVGAAVPFKDLESAIEEHQPEIVCMSITNGRMRAPLYRRYEQFRKFLAKRGAKLIVGGQFLGETKSRPIQADFRAKTCAELEQYLRENFDVSSATREANSKTLN
ncbi:MAG: B12-binding domain-containing protein [Chloroherpetonaceae bacterium]|nr:B12-binding domain-containing protein [Chloroherpetonaceae bacterium]